MKLKKFNQLFEREGFDDIDEYDYKDDYSRNENDDDDDDMSHLCYLLRSMFSNINIDVDVDNSGLDLSIIAQFSRKESLSDIVKVFEVVKKIKKDILAQYSSYYEMWETKTGTPMITFEFMLEDEDNDKDGVVTDDRDNEPW